MKEKKRKKKKRVLGDRMDLKRSSVVIIVVNR